MGNEENIFGWEMRIMQIEEDIAVLEKRKKSMQSLLNGIKNEDSFLN